MCEYKHTQNGLKNMYPIYDGRYLGREWDYL